MPVPMVPTPMTPIGCVDAMRRTLPLAACRVVREMSALRGSSVNDASREMRKSRPGSLSAARRSTDHDPNQQHDDSTNGNALGEVDRMLPLAA